MACLTSILRLVLIPLLAAALFYHPANAAVHTECKNTWDIIPSLIKQAADPVDIQRLTTCQSNYTAAVDAYTKAWSSASSRAHYDVLSWIQVGANEVMHCLLNPLYVFFGYVPSFLPHLDWNFSLRCATDFILFLL
ncbi:hypothetical protein PVL29_008781 [Vitis rotundifolia]|uniref:Pectinesterase inhibitor domain-containing protein n=1 Tax=Vitis rotundifolia TaxID=103349 RepID=A0AA38ZXQ3_VITRO|nr:hypothetical protein PVL29_008781 [Vitis rotundifolia]